MDPRPLGRTGLSVTPIGFGAFKIGRDAGAKYPRKYDLPDEDAVERLLIGVLDLGINYIDTAPAYGLSEERVGRCLAGRRGEFVLSTKVGERFEAGRSTFDFSAAGVRASVHESLRRLGTDVIDVLFIHSTGDDLGVMNDSDAVATMQDLKRRGHVRAIGLSGKTVEGARAALAWADAIMIQYHADDTSHAEVIAEVAAAGVGVVVKKGLASGHLPAERAVRFVLANPGVASLVVGTLNLEHLRANVRAAEAAVAGK
jgi:aryl-alcohol dehydrogenase-like predicted oxidoreductase